MTQRSAAPSTQQRQRAAWLAELAVQSLFAELALYPKPGLVSFQDAGAHVDMDASTFLRSLVALRPYFSQVALAGARRAPLGELRTLGIAAEARMLHATGGINTHRGAIFALGLLVAAASAALDAGSPLTPITLRRMLTRGWGRALGKPVLPGSVLPGPMLPNSVARASVSHGQEVAARFGAGGARAEAAAGFPSVFDVALPALCFALRRGADVSDAGVHAFFCLLAHVVDTNVLYRGGPAAHRHLRSGALSFLNRGSVFEPGWHRPAEALHHTCSRAGLSPGGSADLLAATWFVHGLDRVPS